MKFSRTVIWRNLAQPLLLGSLLLAGATSCYVTHFTLRANTPNGVTTSNSYDQTWHHDGVFALVEFSRPIDLDAVCPGGVVAGIEQRTTFINGFVQSLTRDLYSPQTVTIDCVAGQRAEAVINPDGKAVAYMPIPAQSADGKHSR